MVITIRAGIYYNEKVSGIKRMQNMKGVREDVDK